MPEYSEITQRREVDTVGMTLKNWTTVAVVATKVALGAVGGSGEGFANADVNPSPGFAPVVAVQAVSVVLDAVAVVAVRV